MKEGGDSEGTVCGFVRSCRQRFIQSASSLGRSGIVRVRSWT